jgi:peroxiredoxin
MTHAPREPRILRRQRGQEAQVITKVRTTLLVAVPVSVVVLLVTLLVAYAAKRRDQDGRIQAMRTEADAFRIEKKYAEASDRLEGLQMLLMKERRFEDALKVSFEIEEVAAKASERRSPWHYVRIGEVHLAMGHTDQYFEWIEKAIRERSFSRPEYFRDKKLDVLRNDPRFKKLEDDCAAIIGVGREARDFEVTLLDGSPFRLSAQRGKVVLIDFWDVACGPCIREMPNLKAVYRDFKDRGLEILGISLDTEKPLLDDFMKKASLPWKIACSWKGWEDATAKRYQISATPSTWLVDRNGIVRYCDVRGDELRKAVETLIAESGAGQR